MEFQALATALSLPPHDVMLVGDGSGTLHGKPCGWGLAGCLWDRSGPRATGEAFRLGGSLSSGTNNLAELFPFVHGLWHIDYLLGKSNMSNRGRVSVHMVSDSEVTVRAGRGEYARNANAALWAAIDWFAAHYDLAWHWVPRNSNALNAWCDGESRRCRVLLS
jgi:ribonuclease HI